MGNLISGIEKYGDSTPLSLPPSSEHRCLEYNYTKLGRSKGRSTPTTQLRIDALNTATPNLADLLADLPPSELNIAALNTATLNLADLLAQRVFYVKDLLPTRVTISLLLL